MIGRKIRYYRKQINLTLQEISSRTGLSVGYLSNLERDLTSPTFDNLCSICAAMSINVVDLIMSTLSYEPYIKKKNRKPIYSKDYRFTYEYITDQNLDMMGICMTMDENYFGTETSWGHDTDEYGVVVEGTLAFEVNGETYIVEEGDTIYIKSGTPHKWHKINEGRCVSYWTKLNYIKTLASYKCGLHSEDDAAPEQEPGPPLEERPRQR